MPTSRNLTYDEITARCLQDDDLLFASEKKNPQGVVACRFRQ